VVHPLIGEHRYRGVEQRHVDMLALAGTVAMSQGMERRRDVRPARR
jgi:hypothetical protein